MKTPGMFIYPFTSRGDHTLYNPYIDNVFHALDPYFVCVNKHKPSQTGLMNVIQYFFKIHYLHLNWIEELPDKKAGFFQTLFLLVFIVISRITHKRIIWTLHNKASHSRRHRWIKNRIFKLLALYSNYIITHSQGGVEFIKQLNPGISTDRILYLPHPVEGKKLDGHREIKYDLLLWGKMLRYKGVHLFLEYLEERKMLHKYRILIAGSFADQDYERELLEYECSNIRIVNEYVKEHELLDMMRHSRIILFTYQHESVLSSGALMDSLVSGKPVVGPDIGAFRDMKQQGLIHTYNSWEELIDVIDHLVENPERIDAKRLHEFIEENSWDQYGRRLFRWLRKMELPY